MVLEEPALARRRAFWRFVGFERLQSTVPRSGWLSPCLSLDKCTATLLTKDWHLTKLWYEFNLVTNERFGIERASVSFSVSVAFVAQQS